MVASHAHTSARSVNILLVEDNPDDADLTREAFKDSGLPTHLHVVEDGVEALAYLRHAQPYAAAPLPDLILLDLNLPKKSGHEVLAEIKTDPALKRIPVVVLTTSAAEADITRAYDLSANCYVTKPVELDDFLSIVQVVERFWREVVTLPAR